MTPERWQLLRRLLDELVELPQAARAAFLEQACLEDAQLRSELEAMLVADARAGAALDLPETPVLGAPYPAAESGAEALIGRRLGAYELVGLIGQGGMGAVYRAVRADDQFKKQVAIKLVRRGLDSALVLRRFQAERQILATLEHPYIARLLDAGTSPDGCPYFVMELVDGRPIDRHCHEPQLAVPARLRLFLKVCEAVAYAHRHLVVHRDLKPANILVLSDGTPRLLDFGVAKLLEPGSPDSSTATGLAPMTPEYASPEQVRGERITTASDVYALGVLLYELLAGRRPYSVDSGQPEELLRVVCSTDPPPPSVRVLDSARPPAGTPRELRRTLRGDLDNIVMMALRKEPERRYSSVEQLASDIERHLAGRPVRARPDTFWYRSGKFVRRNRLGSALLAVVLVWAATASYQMRIAERERGRAERRLLDVRRLANSLLFELHDAVRELPGSTHARQLIVGRALEHLGGLAAERGADPALRLELGQAYVRIGEIQYRAGAASLGDSTGALESYARGAELLAPLCAGSVPPREACRALAQLRWLEGTLLKERTDLAGALARYQEALRLDLGLLEQAPGDRAVQRALVDTRRQIGRTLVQQDRLDEALRHQREAVRLAEALRPTSDPADLSALSLATSDLAEALRREGDLAGALGLLERSLTLDRERHAQAPDDFGARRSVAVQLLRRSTVLVHVGDLERAAADLREAQAISRGLAAADPKNALARDAVASAGTRLCEVLLALHRPSEASEPCSEPLRIWTAEFEAHPADDWAWGVAVGHYWAGRLSASRGELQEARTHFGDNLRALEGLASQGQASDIQGSQAATHAALGDLEARAGNRALALSRYARAVELGRPAGRDPVDQEARLSLADVHAAMAALGRANPRDCADAREAQRLYRLAEGRHPLPAGNRGARAQLERGQKACFESR